MSDDLDDYEIDSASDSEEEVEVEQSSSLTPKIVTIEDLEELKAKTVDILDPTWKYERNKRLIGKMLELEEPTITSQMVEFLLQTDACEALIGYITQINTDLSRPSPSDDHTDEIKLAYKTMMLITSDEPSDGLIDFLGKKASMVARLVLRVFEDGSAGSFFHAYRVCELLARYYPTNVFEALSSDGQVTQRMAAMLRYVGYAPVSELLAMIVGLSPIARTSPLYIACESHRWEFMKTIGGEQWNLLYRVAQIVVKPEEHCFTDSYVDAESHSLYACQLFQECVEKLSVEDIGELIMDAIGDDPALLQLFVDTVVDGTAEEYKRLNASKILYFLLRRAADPEIMCVGQPQGMANSPQCVPNRLFSLREKIIARIGDALPQIMNTLLTFNPETFVAAIQERGGKTNIPSGPLQFNSFKIAVPFTTLRLSMMELLVILIESDENFANSLTTDLWKQLTGWCIIYAHHNVYHALFYRLIFAILRQNQEQPHRTLLQSSQFVNFLMEQYLEVPFQLDGDGKHIPPSDDGSVNLSDGDIFYAPPKGSSDEIKRRYVARGLIMNCAHAVRLQAGSQPPTSYIQTFLASNAARWGPFLERLFEGTEPLHRYGMGIQINDLKPSHNVSSLMGLMSENEPMIDTDGGIDHGSNFAKNLGFFDEMSWVEAQGDDDSSAMSRSSLMNLSDDFDSPEGRLSGDHGMVGGPGGYLSPKGRQSLPNSLLNFDKDSQEDADIIDGVTSPIEAIETLERRRESLGSEDSPSRKSMEEPKMSPHEVKQLYVMEHGDEEDDEEGKVGPSAELFKEDGEEGEGEEGAEAGAKAEAETETGLDSPDPQSMQEGAKSINTELVLNAEGSDDDDDDAPGVDI